MILLSKVPWDCGKTDRAAMGICPSLCPKTRPPTIESRISALEVHAKTDSSSDSGLKAVGSGQRDSTPLLDGKTLLSFHNLTLGSSSDSADPEKDELAALLKAATTATDVTESARPAPVGRTFEDVRPDLNIRDLSSGSDSA
jgi:hypothetical protein